MTLNRSIAVAGLAFAALSATAGAEPTQAMTQLQTAERAAGNTGAVFENSGQRSTAAFGDTDPWSTIAAATPGATTPAPAFTVSAPPVPAVKSTAASEKPRLKGLGITLASVAGLGLALASGYAAGIIIAGLVVLIAVALTWASYNEQKRRAAIANSRK